MSTVGHPFLTRRPAAPAPRPWPAREPASSTAEAPRDLTGLRAAVLGANDGIVSVAATVLGVAGASTSVRALLVAGVAALVAGAMSMAAGEYVSVAGQRDAEVAAGAAHPTSPWHAALASLVAFVAGGAVPVLVVLAPWGTLLAPATAAAVLVALAVTGLLSARAGGAPVRRAVLRNLVGGGAAMAVTYTIGTLVGLAL